MKGRIDPNHIEHRQDWRSENSELAELFKLRGLVEQNCDESMKRHALYLIDRSIAEYHDGMINISTA